MTSLKWLSKLIPYLIAILITATIEVYIFTAPGFNLHIARDYSQDGLFICGVIKSIIDNGWFMTNVYLGAPGIYQLYDFPTSDSATMAIIYLLSFFSHNYAVLFNCFCFLTFPICAVFSLYAFSRLGLKTLFALSASLFYTFIPFHLFRSGGHILLTTYYVVPLYILFAVEALRGETFTKGPKSKIFWRIIAIAFAVSSGIYYAFFGAFFILVSGVYGWVNKGRKASFTTGISLCALIALVAIINVSPTLIYQAHVGYNSSAGHRESVAHVEVVSLKMSQMLLPVTGHRIGIIRRFKYSYDARAPLVNENFTATLGIVGSIGFLMLLWLFIISRRDHLDEIIELFGTLNICAVLFATVGGLSFLALAILPQIRSYNRISVFISFFVFYTVFYYLQKKFQAKPFGIKHLFILALIVLVGLLDEIPARFLPDYFAISKEMASDKNYVEKIEAILPPNASIFQVPYSEFPEGAKVVNMKDYEQLKAYVNSSQLKWSYGTMKGRGIGYWESTLEQLPPKKMLDQLVLAGFSGISINKEGYQDNGKQLQDQLTALLKEQPIESQNKKLLFYNLIPYKNAFEAGLSKAQFNKEQQALVTNLYISFDWHPDFGHLQSHGAQYWREGGHKNKLIISNDSSKDLLLTLDFILRASNAAPLTLKINGGPMNEKLILDNKGVPVHKTLVMHPGRLKIYFEANTPKNIPDHQDNSQMFRIENFSSSAASAEVK